MLGQQPVEADHRRPEEDGEPEDRQAEGVEHGAQEAGVAELGERAGEVDEEAQASSQVTSAGTSGRGRSDGSAAQLPR